MQQNLMAMGTDFSDWAELTQQYASGMEALRRREPGASARMMEIARLMTQYQQLLCRSDVTPVAQLTQAPAPVAVTANAASAPRWFRWAAKIVLGVRAQGTLSLSH